MLGCISTVTTTKFLKLSTWKDYYYEDNTIRNCILADIGKLYYNENTITGARKPPISTKLIFLEFSANFFFLYEHL